MTDRRSFWDKKILVWEQNRYQTNKIISKSVATRMDQAIFILSHFHGKKVLEVGCGSGILASQLKERKIYSNYYGVDISGVAIDTALKREIKGATFEQGSIESLPNEIVSEADIIISLGLIDWLTSDELDKLVKISKNKLFLHSFSKKETSLRQLGHQIYTLLLYGIKYKGYTPSYHREYQLLNLFHGEILNIEGMSFGSFITNIEKKTNE